MNSVNVDEKLVVNKFFVDEENPHIRLTANPGDGEILKLVKACPAGLYKLDENGAVHFDYAGCLECGTCRILCGKTILEKWEYPNGGMGVSYRHG